MVPERNRVRAGFQVKQAGSPIVSAGDEMGLCRQVGTAMTSRGTGSRHRQLTLFGWNLTEYTSPSWPANVNRELLLAASRALGRVSQTYGTMPGSINFHETLRQLP